MKSFQIINHGAFAYDYKICQHPRDATIEGMNTLQGDLNRLDLVASSLNKSVLSCNFQDTFQVGMLLGRIYNIELEIQL